VLNLVEYRSWQQALQLKPATVEIVDQTRTSPPAHRVQSGHRNVSGHYPSAKMGVTVQFETKTTQFAAILDFENDRDVLEYWDQPRVGILLPSAPSEKRRHPTAYTPPFFVLRTGSASWVECASESSIEKRCQRDPERFQKDAAGIWHDRMAETYAQQFQFRFEVRVSERRPFDQFHDQIVGADIVNLADVGVIQRRNRTHFALKAVAEALSGNLDCADRGPGTPRPCPRAEGRQDLVRAEPG